MTAGDRVAHVVELASAGRVNRLSEAERGCLVDSLDRQPELLVALGDDPSTSSRLGELRQLADRCARQVEVGGEIDQVVRAVAPEGIDDARVACVRRGLVGYPEDDRRRVLQGRFVDLPPGDLRNRASELLAICGVSIATARSS